MFAASKTASGASPYTPTYIEEVFSTWLYTGNDAALTVTNGIDLATKGGLVWGKSRSGNQNHRLYDTARGSNYSLISNSTGAQSNQGTNACAFNSNGFSLSASSGIVGSATYGGPNYVSWTFRKQPKFFDIVTYTGNGSTKTISHNLGSTPGCIIVKRTASSSGWYVYHRSLAANNSMELQATYAAGLTYNFASVTSTSFNVTSATDTNENNQAYVAYLFAHDAGGFGLTGTDNVISCGSYTGNGSASGPEINLGYEPQFVMIKAAANVRTSPTDYNNWAMVDVMRGMPNPSSGTGYALGANLSDSENGGYLAAGSTVYPTATGFKINSSESMYNYNGCTYIYIAIRRGPMKTPTSGTSVYNGITRTGNGTATTITNSAFTPDMVLSAPRTAGSSYGLAFAFDRLRGALKLLETRTVGAEASTTDTLTGFDTMNGYKVGVDTVGYGAINTNTIAYVNWVFRRAPSVFDVVCYTGDNASTKTVNHNLGVVPEIIITKGRSVYGYWWSVYSPAGTNVTMKLNDSGAAASSTDYNQQAPTSTSFVVAKSGALNDGITYVSYLFASCPGVSKVGSYTGTGATQTIDCGFTGGARWVLIKRTDSTGDWYVWDTARGMVSGTDPSLLLNSTAAEVNANSVYTTSVGFQIVSTASGINASGGTYIYLAIA